MDNLPDLRDIHIPEDVSIFPLAYGWWVLALSLILTIIIYKIITAIIKSSRKRYARKLLKKVSNKNIINSATEISEIIRRICIYKFPNSKTLSGKEWIDFIQQHSKITLNERAANLLANAPYMKKSTEDFSENDLKNLIIFANNWIGENL